MGLLGSFDPLAQIHGLLNPSPQGLLGNTQLNIDPSLYQPQQFLQAPQPSAPQSSPIMSTGGDNPMFAGNPTAYALSQMAATLADASQKGYGTMAGIGAALGSYQKSGQEYNKGVVENGVNQAKVAQAGQMFGGDGFDNQLVRLSAKIQQYKRLGAPVPQDLIDQYNAANTVLATKVAPVQDPNNPGSFIMAPRQGMPAIGQSAPVVQSEAIPAPTFSAPQGGLLPPPAKGGTPDMGLFQQGGATSPAFNPANKNPYEAGGPMGGKTQQEAAITEAKTAAELKAKRDANGGVAPMSETQQNSFMRSGLMEGGLANITKTLTTGNVDPWHVAAGDVAGALGPVGKVAANKGLNDQENIYRASKGLALEGLAATITGAGVAVPQFDRLDTALPSPADTDVVRREKTKMLYQNILNATLTAGPAANELQAVARTKLQESLQSEINALSSTANQKTNSDPFGLRKK